MSKKWYNRLVLGTAAFVFCAVAAVGQIAFAQNPGQIIVTTPTGSELVALQTAGPQSAAISTTNLATWINAGGGGASPGAFTTLSASSTVSGAGFTARFATPGPIGSTTASTGAFTTLGATGAVTLSPANLAVAISPTGSGTVTINPATLSAMDNVAIGANTPSTGAFTTLGATGAVTLSPANLAVAISPTGTGTVAISPVGALTVNPTAASTINNASIGVTTPLAGKFTTLAWTGLATGTFGTDSGQGATAAVCEDTTTHALYFGSGSAGICKGTSSMRFKENIGQIAYGLPQIMQLQPVSYNTKAAYGDPTKRLYGFLAEDVANVMPTAITEYDAQGKPSSVDYVGMIPVLVKAIQQQQAEIKQLKHQLSARR